MREITRHTPGRLFLIILLASLFFCVAVLPFLFPPNTVLFGWLTVPVLSGAVLMLVWLAAMVVYLGRFWPYR